MDWQRYRTVIMGVVALALVGATWWAISTQTGDTPEAADDGEAPALPEFERDDITELEIHLPADEDGDREALTVRLVKGDDDAWRLEEPVQAAASSTAVGTALDKISTLELRGRAATSDTHHARLEVDAAHGIRVIARNGSETLIDGWIGAYQAGNTMLRLEGSDEVLMVDGSIKFAFNKRTRDWRDRAILELTAADVTRVELANDNGAWTFEQRAPEPAEGEEPAEDAEPEWAQVLPEGDTGEGEETAAIPEFDPSKVRTLVSSLARLRAADFGDVSPAEAGFGEGAARVVLTTGDRTETLLVGGEVEEGQRYVMREGHDTIYVVSRFMADRLLPDVEAFQPGAEPAAPPPGGPHGGMPPGMPGGGGPGAGQIPPEVMQQIQRQLQAQGAGGGGSPH